MAEAALKALQASGIKGPNLTRQEFSKQEKKDSSNSMIHFQHNLKNNSTDIRNYVDDLGSWVKDVAKKDKNKDLRDPH